MMSAKDRFVTAIELQRALSKRKHRDVQGHLVVLSSCYNKITRVAGIDATSCIYEVPEFVIGVPPYDLSKAVTHVITSLERNGYEVAYMFPRALFISWDLEGRLCPSHPPLSPLPLLPLPPPVPSPLSLQPASQSLGHSRTRVSSSSAAPPTQLSTPLPAIPLTNNLYRPISEFRPNGRFVLRM